MKKIALHFTLLLCFNVFSQEEIVEESIDNYELSEVAIQKIMDSINNSFTYQIGEVDLDGVAKLMVPKGYKYLNKEQSHMVLTDYWGNPPSETLGLLFPENSTPLGVEMVYAVEITYSEDGFIDDEDAKDIDYDELLEQIREDSKLASNERIKQGYESMEFIGWASAPFYDDKNKKLHWAQEYKFGDMDENTLNYNIRVLGRNGFLNLNVIGQMDALPLVKQDVNQILASVEFKDGYKYSDFNPSIDKVAAYGIGGLIAGKVLAKVGFFAIILKFGKFIVLGLIGLFAAFKRKIFGSKEA